ncbi:MAG: hypothetical protein F4056_10020 [Chloroflexi bacterium]|nr:hypothetical protein [Chloroflexota bacterium]
MAEFRFTREARTPHSESYRVDDGEHAIARADIHLTAASAHATLVIHQSVSDDTLHDLLEALDDEIVSTADPYREDLIVTVWRGEEVGVFADDSDDDEEDESEEGEGDGSS